MSAADEHLDNHGQTPAAWTLTVIVSIASLIGGWAVWTDNWPLFWIGGVGLTAVGGVVGYVMAMMGYGKAHHEPAEA